MADCFPRTVQLRWPPGVDPLKVQEHQQLVLVPFIEEARLCRDLRSRSWTGVTRSIALDSGLFRESLPGSADVLVHAFSPNTSELIRTNQTLLFVRHSLDEKLSQTKGHDRSVSSKWSRWQPPEFRAGHQQVGAIRDPCLTD